jgi:PleD family two-component response regulator
MLTSAGTVVDHIVGFEIGANAYVTKPFDPRELLARVKSVLRRRKKIEPDPEHPQCIGTVRSDCYNFISGGFEEK